MSATGAIIELAKGIPADGWTIEQRTDFMNAVTAILRFGVPVVDDATVAVETSPPSLDSSDRPGNGGAFPSGADPGAAEYGDGITDFVMRDRR